MAALSKYYWQALWKYSLKWQGVFYMWGDLQCPKQSSLVTGYLHATCVCGYQVHSSRYSGGHPCGPSPVTMPAKCWTIMYFSWNYSHGAGWRCVHSCVTWVMVPAQQSSAPLCEKCPEHNIPREMDWVWRTHCMAFWVAWPHSTDFFLWRHLKEHVYAVPSIKTEDLVARLQFAVATANASMLWHVL
jgi:hypothetical protein